MRSRTLVSSGVLVLPFVLVAAAAQGAELYKWVDERGVTNYSNEAPPKGRAVKKLDLGDERFSVYTPDPQLTQAVEAERQKRGRPAANASLTPPPPAPQLPLQQLSPEPRVMSNDPCQTPGSPDCSGIVYDSSPLFYGRRRPPPLVQPQLPPGTIAGNANLQGGTTPGLSGTTPGSTAGNVTGMTGVTPGLSGMAPHAPTAPSSPLNLKGKAPKEELK